MKLVLKILKWILLTVLAIFLIIILFRNQIVLHLIKNDMAKKMKRPFNMLDLPELSDSVYQVLATDFDSCAKNPFDYVISEFKDHDIVFIGENHRIKHDLIFAQNLIPRLYEGGVRNMALEFALNKDSLLIRDVLSNKDFYDEEKANQVFFNLSPYNNMVEYIDLLKAAWEVNSKLPEGAEPFMIHGIMCEMDFSLLKKSTDKDDKEIMRQIRKGVENPERFMADCIINNLLKKDKKAVVYCGIHHAFSGYKGHGNRVGVLVKKEAKDKVMTIALHYPWNSKKGSSHRTVYPANGYLDAFIRKHRSKDFAFGIDVKSTAFGDLTDTSSNYIRNDDLKLSEFCDGYIYLKAFSDAEAVTIKKSFINRGNFEYAKSQFPNPELREGIFKFVGPKVYNEIASLDADIKYQFRHLY